eukprot:596923-Hanusia_phi.AAC.1
MASVPNQAWARATKAGGFASEFSRKFPALAGLILNSVWQIMRHAMAGPRAQALVLIWGHPGPETRRDSDRSRVELRQSRETGPGDHCAAMALAAFGGRRRMQR